MTDLTTNERKVLRAIMTNHFNNSDDPTAEIWADSINEAAEPSGVEGKALSGVVSSLAKKGLVDTANDGREAVVWLTGNGVIAAS